MSKSESKWKNRIVGEALIPATELKGNPKNWRTHGKDQRKAIDSVLDEIGWVQRVIVNKTTGNIVDGHLRAEQALRRKEKVPVLYVELTEEEEMIALATLDPIAALAGSEQKMLDEVINSVNVDNEGLTELLNSLKSETAVPDFAPGTEDDQKRLDQEATKKTCPSCGYEF